MAWKFIKFLKSSLKFLFGWPMTLVVLVIISGYAIIHNLPASIWLRTPVVTVFDANQGDDVFMSVERVIMRPFAAHWTVIVRVARGSGWEVVCVANGFGDYTPDAVLPDPLTLHWWTDGQCPHPPVGDIYVTTLWQLDTNAGRKTVVVTSNVFTITKTEDALLRRP